jgi:hypothetical protein
MVTSGFQISLIAGAIFAIFALLLGITSMFSIWKHQLGYTYPWLVPLLATFRVLFSIGCSFCFLIPVIFLYNLLSKADSLPDAITVEQGAVSGQLLVALSSAIIMGLATAFASVLDYVI